MKLQPGDKTGLTKLLITTETSDPIQFSVTLDNYGSTSTGRRRGTYGVAWDNPLDLNDTWSLNFTKDNHAHGRSFGTKTYSGSFSIPYGYWTLSHSSSFNQYLSSFEGTTSSYQNSGISRTHETNLDWVAHRNAEGKTTIGTHFRSYNAKNYLDDTMLSTSSYRLSILGGSLSHQRKVFGGSGTLKGTYERGLRLLAASKDVHYVEDPTTPRAQFTKAQLDLSYQRSFQNLLPLPFSYAFTGNGQWTPHTLYSAEQISIGGRSTVRGFGKTSIDGDIGGYLRNDLTFYLPNTKLADVDTFLGNTRLVLSYDIGALRKDVKDTEERGVLSGWAAGLKSSGGMVDISFVYAQPLSAPSFAHKRGYEAYLSATVNF